MIHCGHELPLAVAIKHLTLLGIRRDLSVKLWNPEGIEPAILATNWASPQIALGAEQSDPTWDYKRPGPVHQQPWLLIPLLPEIGLSLSPHLD